MEGTTKLNIGNKADCIAALGKPMKKEKGESVEKTFENLMLQFMDARLKAGKESGTLNEGIAGNALTETVLEAISLEDLSVMVEKRVFSGLESMKALDKPVLEEEEFECIACDGLILEDASLVAQGKIALASLEHPAELFEMPKALPTSQEATEDVCLESGQGSTVDLMGNHPMKAGSVDEKTFIPRAGWPKAETLSPSMEAVGGRDVVNAPMIELSQNFKVDSMAEAGSISPSRGEFSPVAAMPQKFRASEPDKIQASKDAESVKPENGFLNSARGQSILNRLTEMQSKERGGSETLKTAKMEDLTEAEVFTKRFVSEKTMLAEDVEVESSGKQGTKRQSLDSGIKVFNGIPVNAQQNVGPEIVKGETANPGRSIENLEEIGEKIDFGMDRVRENGESVIRVRLKPEELGRIEIRLVQENGIVKGSIFVENEGIKEQLSNFLSEDRFLQSQDGIKPKDIEVSVFNQQAGTSKDFGQGDFDFQKESRNGGFSESFKETGDNAWQQGEEGQEIQRGLDLFA